MATVEEREIKARLFRLLPDKLGTLPMAELVESARWYAAEHGRALTRALFHQRAVRAMGGPEPCTCRGELGDRLFERVARLTLVMDDHLQLVEDRRSDIAAGLRCEFERSIRRARYRAAAQAFFHRYPRLRFLRRYFLGRKAVLRWA